ncbi:MAG: hypothetical protein M1817_001144 [Caeruleum heppii]|nr:MAG: hypothetical protein M1817_001144 [Caeruleum heppii]
MIIYKDIITGDEIISDSYPMKEIDDVVYEVDCKMITVGGEDFQLEGANPSAEGEDADDGAGGSGGERKLEIEHAFQLEKLEGGMDKKTYTNHIKTYMKKVKEALKASGAGDDKIKAFEGGAMKQVKKILANIGDYDMYMGASQDPDGMHVLINYREDGITPFATIWKYGLTEMKV